MAAGSAQVLADKLEAAQDAAIAAVAGLPPPPSADSGEEKGAQPGGKGKAKGKGKGAPHHKLSEASQRLAALFAHVFGKGPALTAWSFPSLLVQALHPRTARWTRRRYAGESRPREARVRLSRPARFHRART